MVGDWRECLDAGLDVIAVFLDLSKAFDTVDHELLAYKLEYYNFDNSSLNLIKDYLVNRSIKINVNGTFCHSQPLKIGVHQGSVLGPLLFIIFYNDLLFLHTHAKPTVFADDTTITASGKNIELIIKNLESDLNQIVEWLDHNKLIINANKLQAMLINRTRKRLKLFKKNKQS